MVRSLDTTRLKPLLTNDFQFGVGTSAYQIEGAATDDGRSDSIWDTFCRIPGRIRNGDTGKVACDHYRRWRDDLGILERLGVDAYRFSISWSRVFPDESGAINERGLAFYSGLVDELRAAGIRPMVTLYHWDLPQYLQDRGGWQNRDTVARFAEYAEAIAAAFGRSVDFYTTINEPWCVAFLGHRSGIHAPGLCDERAAYRAVHHLLLAHGLAAAALRRSAPHADVGIVLNGGPSDPIDDNPGNVEAARIAELEQVHLFASALLNQAYPGELVPRFGDAVRPGDLGIIGEPCDYQGWNYYTRNVIRAREGGFDRVAVDGRPATAMGWEIYPAGLERLLTGLAAKYELPPLYVTENGAAFADTMCEGEVCDTERIAYLDDHLAVVAKLVDAGLDIRGYVCWTLMDNFEWAEGYAARFGLVHVDFETQARTIKESGKAVARLLASRDGTGGAQEHADE